MVTNRPGSIIFRVMTTAGIVFCISFGLSQPAGAVPVDSPVGRGEWLQVDAAIEEVRNAILAADNGEYETCFRLLIEARKQHPHLPPSRVLMARLLFARNLFAQGRRFLESAAIESADNPEVYLLFGELALGESRLTDALVHFQKALSENPPDDWPDDYARRFKARCIGGKAIVAQRRGDWPNAKRYFLSWLDADNGNARVRQRLAKVLFKLGEYDLAYQQLKQAAADDTTLDPPAVSMGWLHTNDGNRDEARKWMETAVREANRDADVHAHMAKWMLVNEDLTGAREHAEIAADLNPDLPGLESIRGLVALHQKEYLTAERFFETAHRKDPSNVEKTNRLVLALVAQKDESKRNRALRLAELNVRSHPTSGGAGAALGWVNYCVGEFQEAEELLRKTLVSSKQASPELLYFWARISQQMERTERISDLLRAALEAPGPFLYREEAQTWLEQLGPSEPESTERDEEVSSSRSAVQVEEGKIDPEKDSPQDDRSPG